MILVMTMEVMGDVGIAISTAQKELLHEYMSRQNHLKNCQ